MSAGFSFPVAPVTRSRLAQLGITRDIDLVLHVPLRWEDETRLTPVSSLVPGRSAQVEVTVDSADVVFRPRRMLTVTTRDDAGAPLSLRYLNFYPSQQKNFVPGARLRVFGEPRHGFFGMEMVHPRVQRVEAGAPLPDGLTPVYPTTAGLGQATLRRLILRALETPLADTLPAAWLAELGLPGFAESIRRLHAPPGQADAAALAARTHPAWQRLAFDELFAQQLSLARARAARAACATVPLPPRGTLTSRWLASLPFALTGAQARVWQEISADLAQPHPMRRLLQGDVGSGKTVIAALACLQAVENGYQAALMAPTEILAEQHAAKLMPLFEALGIRTGWISGSLSARARRDAWDAVAGGDTRVVFGTHALFQEAGRFARLGLAVVDEQHRFGVGQRLALLAKGHTPHLLMMSATPIPRTLAMSFFADLDVSTLDELPPGRTPVRTRLVSSARREAVLGHVRAVCAAGGQAYWVCPLIEESEALQLQTAEATHAALQDALPELTIGLVHGRLKTADKHAVMARFQAGEIQVLVATTVIEVGVDVPNASLMVIEHAERMGLAQLHQLRGRVGRGSRESSCVLLFAEPLTELARARLKAIYESADGFEIARQDLLLRGPGELLGYRQSGVPLLRFAELERDAALLEAAQALARRCLRQTPALADPHLERWLGARLRLAES